MNRKLFPILCLSSILTCSFVSPRNILKVNGETIEVSTYQQLNDAIQDGAHIKLANDIVLPESVESVSGYETMALFIDVDTNVYIDGQGHSISAYVTGTDESGILNSYVDDGTGNDTYKIPSRYTIIESYGNLELKNITIRGGAVTAIHIYNGGDNACLIADNLTLERSGSEEQNDGSPILLEDAKAYFVNSRFSRNNAHHGGAINSIMGWTICENCSFTENRSLAGNGGGGAGEFGNNSINIFNNCTFANNTSTEIGGAINLNNHHNTFFINSTIVGNITSKGTSSGGGIGVGYEGDHLALVNNVILNNYYGPNYSDALDSDIGFYSGSIGNIISKNNSYKSVYPDGGFDNRTLKQEVIDSSDKFCSLSDSFAYYLDAPVLSKEGNWSEHLYNRPGITKAANDTYIAPLSATSESATGGVNTYCNVSHDSFDDLCDWSNETIALGYGTDSAITALSSDFDTTYFATPDAGDKVTTYQDGSARVDGVKGACGVTNNNYCTFTILPSKNVNITGATIYGDTYVQGTTINVSAVSTYNGKYFDHWVDAFDSSVTYDKNYFENFAIDKSYTVKPVLGGVAIISNGGTEEMKEYYGGYIDAPENAQMGEEFEVTAYPNEGYQLFSTEIFDDEENYFFYFGSTAIAPNADFGIQPLFIGEEAVLPSGKQILYTGNAEELITAGIFNDAPFYYYGYEFTTDTQLEAKYLYSLEKNGTYSEEIPTATEVGDYTIYVKIYDNMDLFDDMVYFIGEIRSRIYTQSLNPDDENGHITDLLWLIIILSVLDLIGVAGIIYFNKKSKKNEKKNTTKLNTISLFGLVFITWQFVAVIILGAILFGLIPANIILFLRYKRSKKD